MLATFSVVSQAIGVGSRIATFGEAEIARVRGPSSGTTVASQSSSEVIGLARTVTLGRFVRISLPLC